MPSRMTLLHRLAQIAAPAAATMVLAAAGGGAVASASASCPGATIRVTAATAPEANAATLCLVNRERTARGLVPLRREATLSTAATRYAAQMVRQGFFDHVSPSGSTLVSRVRAVGYLDGVRGYRVGENIAWGTGSTGTPRSIVAAWMRSPGHRANILRPAFREIGLGVAPGTPEGRGSGATYVHDFAQRAR